MNSLYGNYRTRKFTEIFPAYETFQEEYNTVQALANLADSEVETTYYLLYGRYGNSSIASSDENRFKYGLWTVMYSYGPNWAKRTELQDKIRQLTDEELVTGATVIYNKAYNPSTEPTTQTSEELGYINEQNVNKAKRSLIDALEYQYGLLEDNVTKSYLDRFQHLFIRFVEPEVPLWYVTELTDTEET